MPKPYVLIAVPAYGSGPYDNMIRFGMLCLQGGMDNELIGIATTTMSYVHMARNTLVKMARKYLPRPTHLMFIDQDSIPGPDTLHRLLSFDKPVIGAVYYKKNQPYMPVVYHFKPSFHNYDLDFPDPKINPEPFKLIDGGIGMGATLIRMDVFDKIEEAFGDQMWFQCPSQVVTGEDGVDREFLMGEDVFFCARLNTIGIEIWCDPTDQVEHVGSVSVSGEMFRANRAIRQQNKIAA